MAKLCEQTVMNVRAGTEQGRLSSGLATKMCEQVEGGWWCAVGDDGLKVMAEE